ncbi:uncharacterized protein LOC100377171 [Saccoglossus kowalevskii]|uniref:Uncharacterized protein LOC100377171 n=1 Tax=Saccoglossus kowalevskii TaxID=10224 RepID=A0ABM0GNK5_SACKO|nr:PREDICTED: uncharacterized protein LOC100377171 [Saccoglossus kowalevskii]
MQSHKRGFDTQFSVRQKIVELYINGLSCRQIAQQTGVSKSTANNICTKLITSGDVSAGKHGRKHGNRTCLTDNILQHIEFYKRRQPSIYLREIQLKLRQDNVCLDVPSSSTVYRGLVHHLNMTRKRLKSVAAESTTDINEQRMLDFIDTISDFRPEQLHWFDEASVIRTTGNRRYGHAEIGKPAIEIQRFASNVNYTINLLTSIFGVEYSDIIVGPSNAIEMMNFFFEAVNVEDHVGNRCLAPGDCVIMDNCGFHHARIVEPNLEHLLQQQGVRLIFQPPYNPEYNICEQCFRSIKSYLRGNQEFSYRFTEFAIADAIGHITPGACQIFARESGYE